MQLRSPITGLDLLNECRLSSMVVYGAWTVLAIFCSASSNRVVRSVVAPYQLNPRSLDSTYIIAANITLNGNSHGFIVWLIIHYLFIAIGFTPTFSRYAMINATPRIVRSKKGSRNGSMVLLKKFYIIINPLYHIIIKSTKQQAIA